MLSQAQQIEFEQLVRDHQPALLREAKRLSRSDAEAWDLAQDTFERAYRSYEAYKARGRASAWLRTILLRLYIDGRRKRRRCQQLEGLELATFVPDEPPLWASFSAEAVKNALAALPEANRTLFELQTVQRLSYDAIALRLQIAKPTVGSRLHRIRSRLRAALLRCQ